MTFFFGKEKNPFSRYIDPTGEFSNRELTLAVGWQRHKAVIQKIGMIVLILWCVGAGFFVLASGLWYAAVGFSADRKMGMALVESFQNFSKIQDTYRARSIWFLDHGDVFQRSPGTYDIVGTFENPNRDWIVHLTYRAAFSGGQSELVETVVLPQTTRPVGVFGIAHASFPRDATFPYEDIEMRLERISAHDIPDVLGFTGERLNFAVSDFLFTPAGSLAGVATNRIQLTITNKSAYRFRQVEFLVEGLYGGERVVVIPVLLEDIEAGETIPLDLRWFSDGVTVTAIKVFPVVNIFDPSVYRAPK